ncbi:WbqC family protein [Hymenobacter aerilatus]|uniref:WbqC family protein n=1 Tax=Hymenobacter aerilatus TaxID=2932251 RepID=A0A8T9SUY2_9BACT|nr:WbqC family protein [Hymenobacter aerilatus]UOR05577.1 WbqC family protein [Hymenobacter aerilatus]
MKVAIMQPYLFPYIGYFQLLAAADLFVVYDDVHYIKKGWINRNRILLHGAEHLFTLPCLNASQNKLINEVKVDWASKEVRKVRLTMETAYRKAPFFKRVYPLVQRVLEGSGPTTIAEVATQSIQDVCAYLGIDTPIVTSSQRPYENTHLSKGTRLVDIVQQEGGDQYLNPIGGEALYTKEFFAEHGIALHFVKSLPIRYVQPVPDNGFVPWLSILDVLMYNEKETVTAFLQDYELL